MIQFRSVKIFAWRLFSYTLQRSRGPIVFALLAEHTSGLLLLHAGCSSRNSSFYFRLFHSCRNLPLRPCPLPLPVDMSCVQDMIKNKRPHLFSIPTHALHRYDPVAPSCIVVYRSLQECSVIGYSSSSNSVAPAINPRFRALKHTHLRYPVKSNCCRKVFGAHQNNNNSSNPINSSPSDRCLRRPIPSGSYESADSYIYIIHIGVE